MTYITKHASPLGVLTIASDGEYITGLWIEGQAHFGTTLIKPFAEGSQVPVVQQAIQWLDRYFTGEALSPAGLPVKFIGTPFQQEVWAILKDIPHGETVTYGQIGRMIASARRIRSMSAQAVGNAVARNPFSIIIPCHRVLGSNGALTGYAGGLHCKEYLLRLEQIDPNNL